MTLLNIIDQTSTGVFKAERTLANICPIINDGRRIERREAFSHKTEWAG